MIKFVIKQVGMECLIYKNTIGRAGATGNDIFCEMILSYGDKIRVIDAIDSHTFPKMVLLGGYELSIV